MFENYIEILIFATLLIIKLYEYAKRKQNRRKPRAKKETKNTKMANNIKRNSTNSVRSNTNSEKKIKKAA